MANEFSIEPPTVPANVARQHDYATPHKTAVVIGVPQGGTSMVAAVIDAIGFPVNRDLYNFESQQSQQPPYCGDTESQWVAKVTAANAELETWGIKDTMVWRFSPGAVHGHLRNPYYLIVARDPIAITQRRCANYQLTKPEQFFGVLKDQVLAELVKMWEFAYDLPEAPMLLISYERALRNPGAFCETTAAFLDLRPSLKEMRRAIDRISPVGGYLTKEEP